IDPVEPKLAKLEFVDKHVDEPNWIVLMNPIFQAFWKQRALPSIRPLNKALHTILRRSCGNHTMRITSDAAFSHNQGHNRKSSERAYLFRFTPDSDRSADILDRQLRAITGREQMQQRREPRAITRSPRRRGRARSAEFRGRAPLRS